MIDEQVIEKEAAEEKSLPTNGNGFKSFDDKLFEERLNKDPFQKELDEAIEQRNLGEFIEEHDEIKGLYEFDKEILEYPIEVNGVEYMHRVKQPTIDDETRKELMSVTVKKSAGKVDGDEAVTAYADNGNALKRYYDGIAVEIFGYPVNEGDSAEEWIPVITVIEEAANVTEEDRNSFRVGEGKDLKLLHLIPDADKLKVAGLVHAGSSVVLKEKNKRVRSIRSRREYVVKQLFGVKRQDDGTFKKPDFVVSYHFAEASAKAISKFDAHAIPEKTILKNEGNEAHRIISIPTCDALFDSHITFIQGASIDSKEILAIGEGDARLKKVPPACKRDATIVYFSFLKS